jgi:hypothetical protein
MSGATPLGKASDGLQRPPWMYPAYCTSLPFLLPSFPKGDGLGAVDFSNRGFGGSQGGGCTVFRPGGKFRRTTLLRAVVAALSV